MARKPKIHSSSALCADLVMLGKVSFIGTNIFIAWRDAGEKDAKSDEERSEDEDVEKFA